MGMPNEIAPLSEAEFERVKGLVLEESQRFHQRLPMLRKELRDRWVVFYRGEVVSHHDTLAQAYDDGLCRFGRTAGHVVALVTLEDPVDSDGD